MLKYFIKCLGLPYLPISICPVIFGAASASYHGGFNWLRSILCLLFVAFAQMTGNLAHQYYLVKRGVKRTASEPDMSLLDPAINPREFLASAITAMLIFDVMLGLALMSQSQLWVILVGAAICSVSYFYQSGPYPLSQHGWSEILCFLLYGPIVVIGTTYINVQSGFSTHVFYTSQFAEVLAQSCISGLCVVAVMLARDFRMMPEDLERGRSTLTVRIGRNMVSCMFLIIGFLIVAVYYYVVACMNHDIAGGTPVPVSSTWIVPMAYLVIQIVIFILMHTLPERKYRLIVYLSMANMALLAVEGVVLSVMFGHPDQLLFHYF